MFNKCLTYVYIDTLLHNETTPIRILTVMCKRYDIYS